MNIYQALQDVGYVPTYDTDSDQWIGPNAELEKILKQSEIYQNCLSKQLTDTIEKAKIILGNRNYSF